MQLRGLRAPGALVRVRDRLPDDGSFTSPLHSTRTAAILGIALGIAFTTCFLTGLVSHAHQHPPSWFDLPSRPAGLYRVTQSLHVATGIATIPLLLAKLWTVFPLLLKRPAIAGVAHALERLSLLPLVAGSVFLLFTGTINIAYWYSPMTFFFTAGHYWAAWITIGALIVHLGAKSSITRLALSDRAPDAVVPAHAGLNRRGFLAVVGAAAGALTLATVGQTIRPLRRLSVLAPRLPDRGPQGYPVNKAFSSTGIPEADVDEASYELTIDGDIPMPLRLSLEDLRRMPQHEAALPIQCVEGWSFSARWRGVRVGDLLAEAGADPGAEATVESLQEGGIYRTSPLNREQAHDPDTLLALELDGEPLALDHGFPLRLIAPNRPGVQQTKWVGKLVVS
ncbi:MAG: molybdopterin-dependent oxidoreductase [Actinomycetota bacterium]|nr:molybdopterin-dependent oxidoreductase [Actinomycetota bacterium]